MSEASNKIAHALAQPFDSGEIKFKVQATMPNGKCIVIAFIDARCVMDRLDEVLGVDGWEDSYLALAGGAYLCKLRVRIDGVWVTKEDVGGASDQPDAGDKVKAAVSDALKRCAVKLGLGRYLYRSKPQYMPYDKDTKKYVGTPQLPTDPNYDPDKFDRDVDAIPPMAVHVAVEKTIAQQKLERAMEDVAKAIDPTRLSKILAWAEKQEFPAKDIIEIRTAVKTKLQKLGVVHG